MRFEPIGDLSRRETVYRAIRDVPSDTLIPYADLPYDRELVIGLRDAVAKTFEREQQRTVVCVPTQGWMIVRGVLQVGVATRKRRSATRRLGRALQIIQTTDRREMSAEERLAADSELVATSTGYHVQRGLASRKFGLDDVREWRDRKGGTAP